MCLQDVVIGRAKRTRVYHSANGNIDVPANPQRLAVRFVSTADASRARLSVRFAVDGSPDSVLVPLAIVGADFATSSFVGGQQQITIDDVGDILKNALFAENLGGSIIALIEVFLDVVTPMSSDPVKLAELGQSVYQMSK